MSEFFSIFIFFIKFKELKVGKKVAKILSKLSLNSTFMPTELTFLNPFTN
jgi:hypothetical protein